MMSPRYVLVLFIILSSQYLGVGACSFSPKIPDGRVRCHDSADCPSGFACIKSAAADEIGICCSNTQCDDNPIQVTDASVRPTFQEKDGSKVGLNDTRADDLDTKNPSTSGGNLTGLDTAIDQERDRLGTGGVPLTGGAIAGTGENLARGGNPTQSDHGGEIRSTGGIPGMDALLATTGGYLSVGGTPRVDAGRPTVGGAILLGGNLGAAGSIGGLNTGGLISFGGNLGDSGTTAPSDVGVTVTVDGGNSIVDAGAGILRFTATPSSVILGKAATLDWKLEGPVHSLSIDQGVGTILGLDNLVVIPLVTTTYTLLLNGTDSAQATVKVNPLPIDFPVPITKFE